MSPHDLPDFHATLLEPSSYPEAPRRIKFEQTRCSLLYRTGSHVYKVRRDSTTYSSLAIKERYGQIALALGRRWAGEAVQALVPIVRTPGGYALGAAGEPVDYALRLQQLPDAQWLQRLLHKEAPTPVLLGRLARFVADRHAGAALEERAAEAGHPQRVQELLDELLYQSRKYVAAGANDPMLEMIARLLARYLEEVRRLMLRRLKRGRIVDGHGALLPEHIHLHGAEVHALSPLDAQPKFRLLDGAADVALLVNALALAGHGEAAELFEQRYASASKDRDLARVLPPYRVLQALRCAVRRGEWSAEEAPDSKERAALTQEAAAFYGLALRTARELPKSA
jgi:uncharacterized protein